MRVWSIHRYQATLLGLLAQLAQLALIAQLALLTSACEDQTVLGAREAPLQETPPRSPRVPIALAASSAASGDPAETPPAPAPASGDTARRALDSEPPDDARRVYAKTRFVWVHPEPDGSSQWIGFLWVGGSAKLRRDKPYYGPGCDTWYAIEPRGYVCVEGTRATLDAKDPVLLSLLPYAPKVDTAWPHRYGESLGLKRFRALPGPTPAFSFPSLPKTLFEDRTELLPRSTVAFSQEMRSGEDTFLLSADYMWVRKDRVTPYPDVTFGGLRLDQKTAPPLAWFRDAGRNAYRRVRLEGSAEPRFEPTGEPRVRFTWVKLNGKSERAGEDTFFETEAVGVYVKESDVVIPRVAKKTPWGDDIGKEYAPNDAPRERRTWIDVSILGGWLIAYEGTNPVYATLVSSGRGGMPVPGKTTLETASTPTGRFQITGKFATATMEAPNEFIHSAVPWAQNFGGPYALHGAYWHDDWGKLKSGGCINVSPTDGKWLFEFTEPDVPAGWHGVRWLPWAGPATRLVVHK